MSNQRRRRTQPTWLPAEELFEPTAPEGYSYARDTRGPTRYRPLQFSRLSDAEYATLKRGAITFEREIELASEYQLKVLNTGCYAVVADYLAELHERLLQLDYLVKSIQARTTDLFYRAPYDKRPNALDYDSHEQVRFVLGLETEAFYYFAHRLQVVFRNTKGVLPFVSRYRPALGVQTVRNKLIEHPESADSGITDRRGSYSTVDGPKVKDARRPGQPRSHMDAGLFVNARELKERVHDVLQRALDSWDDQYVASARDGYTAICHAIDAGDLSVAVTPYSMHAYICTSPRVASLVALLEQAGFRVSGVGDYEYDTKLARAAGLRTLEAVNAILASTDDWATEFLREYYQLRPEDPKRKGSAGGDRDGPMRLLMLAAMPQDLSNKIVEKVTGFPQNERAPTLAAKYNPKPSFRVTR
jgi:hypothetical protein